MRHLALVLFLMVFFVASHRPCVAVTEVLSPVSPKMTWATEKLRKLVMSGDKQRVKNHLDQALSSAQESKNAFGFLLRYRRYWGYFRDVVYSESKHPITGQRVWVAKYGDLNTDDDISLGEGEVMDWFRVVLWCQGDCQKMSLFPFCSDNMDQRFYYLDYNSCAAQTQQADWIKKK